MWDQKTKSTKQMASSNKNKNRGEHGEFVYSGRSNDLFWKRDTSFLIHYTSKSYYKRLWINYKKIIFLVLKNKLYFLATCFQISPTFNIIITKIQWIQKCSAIPFDTSKSFQNLCLSKFIIRILKLYAI